MRGAAGSSSAQHASLRQVAVPLPRDRSIPIAPPPSSRSSARRHGQRSAVKAALSGGPGAEGCSEHHTLWRRLGAVRLARSCCSASSAPRSIARRRRLPEEVRTATGRVLFTKQNKRGFLELPALQSLRWMRLVGDVIFLSGVTAFAWFTPNVFRPARLGANVPVPSPAPARGGAGT